MVLLALIFSELRGQPVTLGHLVGGDENIAVTNRISVTSEELRGYLSGSAVTAADQYRREAGAALQSVTSGDYRKNWPARLQSVPKGATMRMSERWASPKKDLPARSASTVRGLPPKCWRCGADPSAPSVTGAPARTRMPRRRGALLARSKPT